MLIRIGQDTPKQRENGADRAHAAQVGGSRRDALSLTRNLPSGWYVSEHHHRPYHSKQTFFCSSK
jgi:hypothetical protein